MLGGAYYARLDMLHGGSICRMGSVLWVGPDVMYGMWNLWELTKLCASGFGDLMFRALLVRKGMVRLDRTISPKFISKLSV